MNATDPARPSAGLRWFFGVSAVLAAVAGFQLFVGAADTDRFFSWTIDPPLTAAFLGAAYWAAMVLLAWAAGQRSWARARTALPAVFTIAVLLVVATVIHLDRFHHDLFGRFWEAVYLVVVPLLAYLTWSQVRRSGPAEDECRPLPGWLRAVLCVQALGMLALGVALFAAPVGASSLWPWALTPLTGRAIGAFLVGFGAAAAFAVGDDEFGRLHGAALAYATLGALELAAAAFHGEDFTAPAMGVAVYVAACASVLAVGLYGAVRSPGSAERPPDRGSRPP
ncbi:MAG TPA: hypothetical protein VN458_08840 [Solirubrobacterales bacterium]|nr:hypothetical protein [Solirubrobacterales bacterium]